MEGVEGSLFTLHALDLNLIVCESSIIFSVYDQTKVK